jgi:hypothetical protein
MHLRFGDYIFSLFLAAAIVITLVAIGNVQANQYRSVVTELRNNSRALVCILRIVPAERTTPLVNDCLLKNGVTP